MRHPITMRSAGSGRLLAAFAQPAFMQTEPGCSISVVSVAEPGNQKVEAGSATAEALDGIVPDGMAQEGRWVTLIAEYVGPQACSQK